MNLRKDHFHGAAPATAPPLPPPTQQPPRRRSPARAQRSASPAALPRRWRRNARRRGPDGRHPTPAARSSPAARRRTPTLPQPLNPIRRASRAHTAAAAAGGDRGSFDPAGRAFARDPRLRRGRLPAAPVPPARERTNAAEARQTRTRGSVAAGREVAGRRTAARPPAAPAPGAPTSFPGVRSAATLVARDLSRRSPRRRANPLARPLHRGRAAGIRRRRRDLRATPSAMYHRARAAGTARGSRRDRRTANVRIRAAATDAAPPPLPRGPRRHNTKN